MAKIIDITERLESNENPRIKIGNKEYEVNADAPTVLKIMGMMQEDDFEAHVLDAFNLLFSSKTRKELEKQKLSFRNMMTVIQVSMRLATGADDEEDAEGEAMTRTTT